MNVVFGESVQELTDLVLEGFLEGSHCGLHTLLIRLRLVNFMKPLHSGQPVLRNKRILLVLLDQFMQKLLILIKILQVLRRDGNHSFEVLPGPLNGMLDLVREQLQGADGKLFLWGIDDIVVAQGVVRDDDLGMALGPQGAAFEEGLLVPDALVVDELAGLHIVHCIYYQIGVLPELVVKNRLCVWTDFQLERLELASLVQLLADMACNLTFIPANMFLPEKELPIQITDLNVIIIGDNNLAFLASAEAHQPEHLDKLAAQCPRPDKEDRVLADILHELVPEDDVVIGVAGVQVGEHGFLGGVNVVLGRDHLAEGVVQPLPEGAVLAV